jgi:hypothetical protein
LDRQYTTNWKALEIKKLEFNPEVFIILAIYEKKRVLAIKPKPGVLAEDYTLFPQVRWNALKGFIVVWV